MQTLSDTQIQDMITECSLDFNKKNTIDEQAIADAFFATKLFNALCIMQENSWKDRFDNKTISIEFKYGSKEEPDNFKLRWNAAEVAKQDYTDTIPNVGYGLLSNFLRFKIYSCYIEGLKEIADGKNSEPIPLFWPGVDHYFAEYDGGDKSSIRPFTPQLCEVWVQDGEKKRSAEELDAVFQHFAKEVAILRDKFNKVADCVWRTSWYIVSVAKKVSEGGKEERDKEILSHASVTCDKDGKVTMRNKFTNEEIKSAYFTPAVLQICTDLEQEKQLNNLYKVLGYSAAVVVAVFAATCFLSSGFRGAVFSGLSPIVNRFCNVTAKGEGISL